MWSLLLMSSKKCWDLLLVQFKQPCDIMALLLFFFVCFFFFVFFSRTDRFFNLSCHLFSYPLSLKQTSSFTKIIFFFGFSQKIKRGKKSFVPSLSLCRSRQILGYVCRPIKGSQLTPYVQVRLTCLPSNIHVFLFKQISCLQGVVYNTFLRIMFFFTMCDFQSSFENVIELEWDVIFAIFAVLMAVVVCT